LSHDSFKTHHNSIHESIFLVIITELTEFFFGHLKKLACQYISHALISIMPDNIHVFKKQQEPHV